MRKRIRIMVIILLLAAAFCAGYIISPASTVNSLRKEYVPTTTVIEVKKAKNGEVLYYADGIQVQCDNLAEFLRKTSLAAGFFSAGTSGSANCRLIVKAGDNIRWKDLQYILDYAGRNCLYDVFLASNDIILPLKSHHGALYPFYQNGRFIPTDVLVCVLWVDKAGREQAVSEDGQLSFVVLQGRPPLPVDLCGRLIPEYMPEEDKIHRTRDLNSLRGLLTTEWGWNIKVLVHAGRMVPVTDLLGVLQACSGRNTGYVVLAPEKVFEEDLKELQEEDK
jgi:hypothetical protein